MAKTMGSSVGCGSTFAASAILVLLCCCMRPSLSLQIMVACGSGSSSSNWTGDEGSTFKPAGDSQPVNQSKTLPADVPQFPYGTGRVLRSPIEYTFPGIPVGMLYVRLHFYPSSYAEYNNVGVLNINCHGYFNISNFNASDKASQLGLPYFSEEFLLNKSDALPLNLSLTPATTDAIINGIEISTTDNFPYVVSSNGITQLGQSLAPPYTFPPTTVLETSYRVSMGSESYNDPKLGHVWIEDQKFLIQNDSTTTKTLNSSGTITTTDATPVDVYRTGRTSNSSMTWSFPLQVSRDVYVRLYFCELDGTLGRLNMRVFDVFINGFIAQESMDIATSGEALTGTQLSYYVNFDILGDTKDHVNVTLSPKATPNAPASCLLNGLEILQILSK